MDEPLPALLGVDHVHVHVADRPAAQAWYARVLGLHPDPALLAWDRDGGPLTLADASGRVHLALFEREPRPSAGTVALAVDGPAFLAWRQHLALVLDTAPALEDHDLSWSLYFADPDGNPYEITTYDHGPVAAALEDEGTD